MNNWRGVTDKLITLQAPYKDKIHVAPVAAYSD